MCSTSPIRNTVSHNFRFDFSRYKPGQFPITWRGISLTADLHAKVITFESFWHKSLRALRCDAGICRGFARVII